MKEEISEKLEDFIKGRISKEDALQAILDIVETKKENVYELRDIKEVL